MKRLAFGLVSLALSAMGLAADAVPATYRLDFFHTGGKGVEIFAVDRLRQEPLPWPGHPSRAAVGAFQGANYDAQAYFRPQLDCIMFTRDQVPFCRVCESALEQVIDSIAPDTARP